MTRPGGIGELKYVNLYKIIGCVLRPALTVLCGSHFDRNNKIVGTRHREVGHLMNVEYLMFQYIHRRKRV